MLCYVRGLEIITTRHGNAYSLLCHCVPPKRKLLSSNQQTDNTRNRKDTTRRGGLPYETDGDARRLAKGCKFWILVSLRVFQVKRQYFMPPRSRLGFHEERHEHDEELEIYDNAFKNYF